MKVFFRRIHLYLAFVAGIVIMITCFTGAVLVFEEELQHLFHKERYYVEPGTARPIQELSASLQQKVPAATISGIKIYTDKTRSAELYYTVKKKDDKKKDASPTVKVQGGPMKPGQPATRENNRQVAYVNPYTAEIIELYNNKDSFFYSMLSLHRWLLGGDTGKLIVGICTLIFLFILITGIILWWPKNRMILQQRLKIKWQGGWKRLNHDLHIVTGFYSAIFLFIFAFTGLAWSFTWFNKGIYKVTNSSMELPKPPVNAFRADVKTTSLDSIFAYAKTNIPGVKFYVITSPKDSLSPYSVSVLKDNAPHESAMDMYYINRYEPAILQSQQFSQRNLGQKVRSTFKPVHTASIWGWPSKIIGFIVCVLGVIFPVTGYIMWWLRTSKKARKTEPV